MKKLFLPVLFFLSFNYCFAGENDGKPNAAMSGIYTVNPAASVSATNFIRIGQADTALMTNGISGPVTIQIYNGTYSQANVGLGAVAGSSAANPITFTSFSNDSVQVVITSTLNFTGASFITLKKLNLSLVVVDGNVSDYTITNNQILGFSWLGGDNILFTNNYIKPQTAFNNLTNPGPAITFAPKTAPSINNLTVEGNIFRQVLYFNQAGVGTTGVPNAINFTKVNRPVIRSNTFRNITMSNVGYGLIGCCTYTTYPYGSTFQFDRCTDTAFVEKNRFDSISTDRLVHDIDNTNTNNPAHRLDAIIVRNNFFTVFGTLGMIPYAAGAANIQFYYNNVNNIGSGSPDLEANVTVMKDNIFSSTNGKVTFNFATHPGSSDYNDFYTSGPVLVSYSGTPNATYATLAQYQAATTTNANSKNVNPKYYDSANLHIRHPLLLAVGTPYPVANPLLKDIDDDNRNSLNPCIGADEFLPPTNDVVALQYTSPKINFTAATPLPLKLKFINNGSVNLAQVNIRWSVNGVEQAPYAWNGNLAYDSTTEVTFANYTFDMVKYNSLKVWTDLPNAVPDMVPVNDTIRVDSIMPYARGGFTLGGITPHFSSFIKANELLNYGGVDSAVSVNLRNGKYTEQPIIKFTRGASVANTITFRGENNIANLDTLSFSSLNSGTTPFFTMRLDSAAYYSFKNITFQSLSQYSREIEFSRKTRFITFDSCVFTAASSSAANAHVEGNTINSLAQLDSNVVFTNNRFLGSYSGIQLPLRNGFIKGNRFENMIIGNSSFGVIHLTGSFAPLNNTLLVDSNYVGNPVSCTLFLSGTCFQYGYVTIPGIYISSTSAGNNFEVAGNKLYVNGRNGIQMSSPGTAASPIRIFNNFITMRGGGNTILSTGDYAEIYNNSLTDSANVNVNLVELRGNNTVFKNNILVKGQPGSSSTSTASLLYVLTTAVSTLTSTNNVYYITDTSKAVYNGTTAIGLGQWKATGKDANSVYTVPAFLNITSDLHIDKNKAAALDLSGRAIPVSYIGYDIDDSTRSLTAPCIGADEFMLNPVDGGVSAVTSPTYPMPAGTNNIAVSIRNYGSSPLTSAVVNWTINGAVQTPYSYSGSLATGDSATNIVLGSFNFSVPQAYVIKAWTSNVNGGGDTNPINDSTIRAVYPALCGAYTVGGFTPDFTTPKAAFSYASLAGVTCPAFLNIRDGLYNETDTIKNVPGTSPVNILTVQSESLDSSKVTIYQTDYAPSTPNPILLIDNAKYITLKNIGIKRTVDPGVNHLFYALINLTNDVKGLTITNCEIATTGAAQLITYPTQINITSSNITVSNNNFIGGYGVSLSGWPGFPMTNVAVTNNNFRKPIPGSGTNAQVTMIYMGNININNNYLDSTTSSAGLMQGINLQSATGKISITNNKIVKRKAIHGIYMSQVTGLNTYDSAVVIANNFMVMDSVGNNYALYSIGTGRNVKVIYNNLLNNCSTASSTNSYALYFTNSFGTGTLKDTIANNNIIVTGTGYGLYESVSSAADVNCTNNNIWSAASTKLATYNSTNYTTIAALATGSGTHTATVSMNPVYVNNNDLHITEVNLRNLGKPFPYILTDIDGDTRGTVNSSIGADELILANIDAGISAMAAPVKSFAAGNQNVSVTVKNYGNNNLTAATINWSINGTPQTPFSYSGNLAFNTTANVVIGSVNFVVDSAYNIKAWTTAPNSGTDGNTSNDTVTVNNVYPALSGTYTIGGVTPDFKSFARTTNNLKYGGMLGNVIFNARDGRYNEVMYVDSIPFQNNFSVIWQSESNDSSKVVLAGAPFTGDNNFAVIQVNNARNITFRKLTVQVKPITPSSTYTSLIYFSKKTKNVSFLSNLFLDSTYTITGGNVNGSRFLFNRDVVAGGTIRSADTAMIISGNLFRQVNFSTVTVTDLTGGTHIDPNNTTISHNNSGLTFSNNKYDLLTLNKTALDLSTSDTIRIIGNKLTGLVLFTGSDYILVDKNSFYFEGNSQNVVTATGTANRVIGKPVVISNNTIQAVRTGLFNGTPAPNAALYLNFLDRANIIHNTIVTNDTGMLSGGGVGAAFYMSQTKFDTVKNNIFYNTNGGNLLYQNTVTNYIANGNDYGYSNHFSNNAANLAAQKVLYSQDAQSVENIQPYFRGPKDLHASNILLKAAAAVTPSNNIAYLTDLDGQARSTTVCYGADEFTQPLNDMVVLDASPKKVFSEGLNTFSIHVYNNGINPITSFNTTASITNYPDNTTPTVNAGNLSYTYAGNIAPGAEANITIGQMSVPLYRNILKVNTTNLNGVGDDVNFDDSLQIDNYYAGLNGNYTFRDNNNSNPATFKYFNDASIQLKFGGVYGPSTLSLLPGIYNSNQFYVDSIPNRGALSPLVIQSQNGDSSSTGFAPYFSNAVVIYKANNVTIKNLYFGVPNNDASYNGLTLGYNSQNMTVQNCRFVRPLTSGTLSGPANVHLVIGGSYSGQFGYTDSAYTIKNNSFEGGFAGIYLFANVARSSNKNSYSKNNFINQGTWGMNMMLQKNALIDSNTITTNTTDPAYIAVQADSHIGRTLITRNRIFIATDGTGIKTLETYLPVYQLTDTLLVANNFITAGATGASVNMFINTAHKKQTSIYHNSMLNRSTSAAAISLKTQTQNNLGGRFEVLNNIMYHKFNGIPVSITKDANVTYVQHNENLYTPGAVYGSVNGTNYATLANLASTAGIDYSSVSGDPLFISDVDLHVDGALVNNTGSFDSYTQVSTDIDNDVRSSTTPDIGADEFKLPNFGVTQLESPLSSCSHTSAETVKAWVKNFGSAARTNIPVAYRINLGTIIRDTVRTPINPGDSVLFSFLQKADLSGATDYYFDVWTAYRGDSLPSNDSLKQFLVATTTANNILPYYTGFEGTPAGWYTGGQNTSFKWGVIFSGVIDSAANGLNAWKSNPGGPHNNNETSYLYSPCFDLSSVTQDPVLNFNVAYQLENGTDKAWVEYSADAGATWTKLGAAGEGLGWYNNAGGYWTGDNHFWHDAKHLVPAMSLGDRSRVRLRFVLQTNSSVVQDGIAIDDISLYNGNTPPISLGIYANRAAVSTGSGTYISFNNPNGDRIAEINDNGNNLGTVTIDVNQSAGNAPTFFGGSSYMDRSFVIHAQNQPSTPVRVRLYFTQAEFDAWKAADANIDQVRNISVYKFSGSTEDFDLSNNTTGTSLTIAPGQISKIPYLDGYFLEFTVTNFSEFWITKGQPPTTCISNNISFTAASSGSTYQWQVNNGSGYSNIANGGYYTGTNTAMLTITGIPTYNTGNTYRCVVDGVNGPDNTLRFILTWSGAVNTDWANPGNWSCSTTPDEYTDVVIPGSKPNYPLISVSTSIRKLTTQTGSSITVGTNVNLGIKGK